MFKKCTCVHRTHREQEIFDRAGSPWGTASSPYAIICAGAVNQDGRSSGLTAPNGPSQTALVQEALVSGQLQASAVGTVSVHGTGTPLGDPIEVGALGQGLRAPQPSVGTHRPLELVSNKSCFGHTEGAAGLTGLLLAVRCLQDSSRPAIMHMRGMNPHVGAALADWQRQMGLDAVIPRQSHGVPRLFTSGQLQPAKIATNDISLDHTLPCYAATSSLVMILGSSRGAEGVIWAGGAGGAVDILVNS